MGDTEKLLLGAGLAIFGGIVGKFISVFVDEWRERKFIKRSISDELSEIIDIISKFNETYNSSRQLVPSYLDKLEDNTESYSAVRQRLYLIWKEKQRMDIIHFYRDLQKEISEHRGKLGSLTPNLNPGGPNETITVFNGLKQRAETLNSALR